MTTKEPASWLRYVEKALIDLDAIPLHGRALPFEWQNLQEKLKEFLQIPNLTLHAHNWSWLGPEQFNIHTNEGQVCLNIAVLPLQGYVSVIISQEDLNALSSWVVQHKANRHTLVSSQFAEGLAYFIATEVLHDIQSYASFDGFLLRLLSEVERPSSRALVLDVSAQAYQEELTFRLVVPEQFHKQWLQHHSKKPKKLPAHLCSTLSLECSLDAARVSISMNEWQKISPGDFIPLNQTALDLKNHSGSVYFSVCGKPLFRARIKNNGLKILEQPIYEEDSMNMDHENDDLLSEISDLEAEKNKSLDPIPEEIESDDQTSLSQPPPIEETHSAQDAIAVQTEKSPLEKIEMVPLNVVVEVARFKMSCEKLLHLKPGNLIELNVSLEKPVDLVANGKKIATGELVRIGETLGVQILDIG